MPGPEITTGSPIVNDTAAPKPVASTTAAPATSDTSPKVEAPSPAVTLPPGKSNLEKLVEELRKLEEEELRKKKKKRTEVKEEVTTTYDEKVALLSKAADLLKNVLGLDLPLNQINKLYETANLDAIGGLVTALGNDPAKLMQLLSAVTIKADGDGFQITLKEGNAALQPMFDKVLQAAREVFPEVPINGMTLPKASSNIQAAEPQTDRPDAVDTLARSPQVAEAAALEGKAVKSIASEASKAQEAEKTAHVSSVPTLTYPYQH